MAEPYPERLTYFEKAYIAPSPTSAQLTNYQLCRSIFPPKMTRRKSYTAARWNSTVSTASLRQFSLRPGGVSIEAKVLYDSLLDRMGLFVRTGWTDSNGRSYIYSTQEDDMTLRCLSCPSHENAIFFVHPYNFARL